MRRARRDPRRPRPIAIAGLLLLAPALIGCGQRADDAPARRRLDRAVEDALRATQTAEAAFDATVAVAVAGTATQLAGTAAAGRTPVGRMAEGATPEGDLVVTTLATPLPTRDVEGLNEAELAAAVEAAVAAARAPSDAASAAGRSATADGAVDPAETLRVEVQIAGAEDWLAEAERLLATYTERYGALAEESRRSVAELEAQLGSVAEALDALQGWSDLAEARATEVAERVASALATAQARATERHQRIEDWRAAAQATLEAQGDLARRGPRERPRDLPATLAKLGDFGRALREGLADGEIDPVERAVIAELGAEAAAGLHDHGGPLMQRLAEDVDRSLDALERGDWDALRAMLRRIEAGSPSGEP
ncbi:MAG: hypothetical protein H6648_08285 [Caldilineae bacterium]|nr:hypothetical protein [Caldilineae bacterium]